MFRVKASHFYILLGCIFLLVVGIIITIIITDQSKKVSKVSKTEAAKSDYESEESNQSQKSNEENLNIHNASDENKMSESLVKMTKLTVNEPEIVLDKKSANLFIDFSGFPDEMNEILIFEEIHIKGVQLAMSLLYFLPEIRDLIINVSKSDPILNELFLPAIKSNERINLTQNQVKTISSSIFADDYFYNTFSSLSLGFTSYFFDLLDAFQFAEKYNADQVSSKINLFKISFQINVRVKNTGEEKILNVEDSGKSQIFKLFPDKVEINIKRNREIGEYFYENNYQLISILSCDLPLYIFTYLYHRKICYGRIKTINEKYIIHGVNYQFLSIISTNDIKNYNLYTILDEKIFCISNNKYYETKFKNINEIINDLKFIHVCLYKRIKENDAKTY